MPKRLEEGPSLRPAEVVLWVGNGDVFEAPAPEVAVDIGPPGIKLESKELWCNEAEAIAPGVVTPLDVLVEGPELPEVALMQTKTGPPFGSSVIAVPTTVSGPAKQSGVPTQAVIPEIVEVAHVAVDVKVTLGRGGPSETIKWLVVV